MDSKKFTIKLDVYPDVNDPEDIMFEIWEALNALPYGVSFSIVEDDNASQG